LGEYRSIKERGTRAMEIISNIALISINETLIVQVVGFLVFMFVINRIMFRPLQSVMSDREIHIERVKQAIDQAREEVVSITNQIQKQEAATRDEAMALKGDLEANGSQQAKEIFESVKKEIAASSQKAQREIADRIAQERRALEKETQPLALNIIAKILDRRQQP
jgi:F-type H+-transporting ATPase subunit b